MSVSYGGDKITFDDGSTASTGWAGFRNRLINGAMVIDQRNAGASVTVPANGGFVYTVDRWFGQNDASQTFSVQRSTDTPNSNFPFSVRVSNTTAASPSSAQQRIFGQNIEGLNLLDIGLGTPSCQQMALSFWVKSSTTGTYGFAVENPNGLNAYVAQYTINSANTWEFKSFVIPAITTGTFATNTSAGLGVYFDLGSGTNFEGTPNTWNSADRKRASGNVNLFSNSNQSWFITGVQLEKATSISSFEYRPYGTELQLCQRYLPAYRHNGQDILPSQIQFNASTTSRGFISFPVPTRVPVSGMTISSAGHFTIFGFAGGNGTATAFTMHAGGTMGAGIDVSSGSSFTTRDCGTLGITNSSGFVYFTGAEL